MEQPSTPLNWTLESQATDVPPSERMMPHMTVSPIILTGENESNLILQPSESPSSHKSETSSVTALSSLRSRAKPHEILEKLPIEPRILQVSKDDVAALVQVLTEFKEQFVGY